MKPLTIEELKALPIDDWVWVKSSKYKSLLGYAVRVDKELGGENENEVFGFSLNGSFWTMPYLDYGKTWLAYKNKEQAVCKGEIVELPCKIGDKVYGVGYDGRNHPFIREHTVNGFCIKDGLGLRFDLDSLYTPIISGLGTDMFLTQAEAEKRLAELKGEN